METRRDFIKGAICAAVTVGSAYAQEAFDEKETIKLFEGTTWHAEFNGWKSDVTFKRNKKMDVTASGYGDKNRPNVDWAPIGPRTVQGDDGEWKMSPDGKELYAIRRDKRPELKIAAFTYDAQGKKKADPKMNARLDPIFTSIDVFYKGTKIPPKDPSLQKTVAEPGTVWEKQGGSGPTTLVFNMDFDVAYSRFGSSKIVWPDRVKFYGGGQFYLAMTGVNDLPKMYYLIQDENGEKLLCDWDGGVYKARAAQAKDPLPPRKLTRKDSPIYGTSWCRMVSKDKTLTFIFDKFGNVAYPGDLRKSEWDYYDDGSIRCKANDKTRRLVLNPDQNRLMFINDDVREIWYAGSTPPKMDKDEEARLKAMLEDESKAWVGDFGVIPHLRADGVDGVVGGFDYVYTYDSQRQKATISVCGQKPKTVFPSLLCAGCIRIDDKVFMVEGDKLECVESRLTLKQVAKASIQKDEGKK